MHQLGILLSDSLTIGSLSTPMQGINRLGKAAPKPGSLRPPDPNRRQDLDLFSEGAETDADYMRMVHDVRLVGQPCIPLTQRLTITVMSSAD